MFYILCILSVLFCNLSFAATEVKQSGTSKGYINVLDFVGPTVSVTGITGTVTVSGGSASGGKNAVQYNSGSSTFAGDESVFSMNGTNVGIGTTNGKTLFDVNNKFNVLSGGNIGIGTNVPGYVNTILASNVSLPVTIQGSAKRGAIEFSNSDNAIDSVVGSIWGVNGISNQITGMDMVADGAANSGLIRFSTAVAGTYTEKIRLSSAGNLGIGTVVPGSLLNIVGSSSPQLLFTDTNAGVNVKNYGLLTESGLFQIRRLTDGLSGFTATLTIDSGNVGIGTTIPAGPLHVYSSTLSQVVLGDNTGAGNYSAVQLRTKLGNKNWLIGAQYNVDSALEFTSSTAANGTTFSTPTMILLAGNVGVGGGTSPPLAKFQVTGASAASSGGSGNGIAEFTTGTGVNADNKMQLGIVDGSYGWIQTVAPSVAYRNLALNPSGGNVGIGSVSPGKRLDVQGVVRIAKGSAAAPAIVLGIDADTDSGIYSVGTDDIRFANAGVNSVTITAAGNVGIGTIAPVNSLEIKGDNILKMTGGTLSGINVVSALGTMRFDNGGGLGFIRSSATTLGIGLGNNDGPYGGTILTVHGKSYSRDNVGIGTFTMANMLVVNGAVGIGTANSANYVQRLAPAGGMIIEGNVGIGTWVVNNKLQIGSNATATGQLVCFGTNNCLGYCTLAVAATGACSTCTCLIN